MIRGTNSAARIQNSSEAFNQSVKIIQKSDNVAIQFDAPQGQCELTCTGANGGRITSFKLDGMEILVQPNASGMFGSTFWTSPENWGWPPPAVIDANAYGVKVDSQQAFVELTSAVDPRLGVRIQKRFSVASNGDAINVDYTIANESGVTQQYAPWEISRVEKGGVTFYRPGSTVVTAQNRGVMTVQRANSICAYHHPVDLTDDAKLFDTSADNWIAHTNGKLLLVKQFDACVEAAPGEADIEIYACPNYVEVEQQGTFTTIQPDESHTWRVSWSLHLLPKQANLSDTATLAAAVDCILEKSK